jgi:glycerol-3-phosphate acyltransferase PlsX
MAGTLKVTRAAPPFALAIDAMGGDSAPEVVLDGLELASERHPEARFLLVGDEALVGGALARRKRAARACSLRHAPDRISGDMKPTAALRVRGSSMRVAIDAVAGGEAAGIVSAGNTGALMALSKIVIKTMPEIDRPALAAIGPSARGDVVLLDLGANVQCDARNLVEFAVMGDAFARAVLGLTSPSIGLLNVGSEELKGDDRVRHAAEVLRDSHIGAQFRGFVEGHDITAGTTDVVVTDGFTGNVALKTGEGTAALIRDFLGEAFRATPLSRIAALLALTSLKRLTKRIDPRRVNGGVFLGLNGTVVKSHGSADATGVSAAIKLAFQLAASGFNERLAARVASLEPPGQDAPNNAESEQQT